MYNSADKQQVLATVQITTSLNNMKAFKIPKQYIRNRKMIVHDMYIRNRRTCL